MCNTADKRREVVKYIMLGSGRTRVVIYLRLKRGYSVVMRVFGCANFSTCGFCDTKKKKKKMIDYINKDEKSVVYLVSLFIEMNVIKYRSFNDPFFRSFHFENYPIFSIEINIRVFQHNLQRQLMNKLTFLLLIQSIQLYNPLRVISPK